MPARTFGTPTLEVRHVPDYSLEPDTDGNNQRVELPGKVYVGAVVDGVFVPLAERKAGGFFKDLDRAASSGGDNG
jgi:hypothetical protein